MDLYYYQYKIGQGKIRYGAMHESLTEVTFDQDFNNSDNPFLRQVLNVLTQENINPVLKKNILRGLHFRDDKHTIIIDYPSLPLKFISKGYFHDKYIKLGLGGSEISEFEDFFLTEDYYYFYATKHPFSQWHKSSFRIDDFEFNSAEQFMMFSKAKLFGDFEIADKILKSKDVREQKMLGRQVKGFEINIWESEAMNFIYIGNKVKFTQNNEFKDLLVSTNGKTLVEASPTDIIWGIGLEESNENSKNIWTWRGTNWLGIVLTELREELIGNTFENGFLQLDDFKQLKRKK